MSNQERHRGGQNRNWLVGKIQLETAQYALTKTNMDPPTLSAITRLLDFHDKVITVFADKLTTSDLQAGPQLGFHPNRAEEIRTHLIVSLQAVEQDVTSPENRIIESRVLREFLSEE